MVVAVLLWWDPGMQLSQLGTLFEAVPLHLHAALEGLCSHSEVLSSPRGFQAPFSPWADPHESL